MSRTVRHRDKTSYWRKASGTSRKARHRRDVAVGMQSAFGEDRPTSRVPASGEPWRLQRAPIAEPDHASTDGGR